MGHRRIKSTQAVAAAVVAGLGACGVFAAADLWGGDEHGDRAVVERTGAVADEPSSARPESKPQWHAMADRGEWRQATSGAKHAASNSMTNGSPKGIDDVVDPVGSEATGRVPDASEAPAPTMPERVEVGLPDRVIVHMPRYRPGTPPTVHQPTVTVVPPAVSHTDSTVTVHLPQASMTPPKVEQGEPGELTPPSVEIQY